ncbi:hypothetical protein GJ496_003758 [Pomphorhynchus laevis]|nr:hypothetical protein GJ496_003758 [Pomphorhynchus laevis]
MKLFNSWSTINAEDVCSARQFDTVSFLVGMLIVVLLSTLSYSVYVMYKGRRRFYFTSPPSEEVQPN